MLLRFAVIALIFLMVSCANRSEPVAHRQHVFVEARPAPAHIYADGKLLGKSPILLELERFQTKTTFMSALPTQDHHFRQDVILEKGELPTDIVFFMDIPAKSPNSDGGTNDIVSSSEAANECSNEFLTTVFFDTNQYLVNDSQRERIQCFAVNILPTINKLQLIGYADERDSVQKNKILALKRAQQVANVLVALGVDPRNMEVISAGEITTYGQDLRARAFRHHRKVSFEIVGD